jgi:hypothetical protein
MSRALAYHGPLRSDDKILSVLYLMDPVGERTCDLSSSITYFGSYISYQYVRWVSSEINFDLTH